MAQLTAAQLAQLNFQARQAVLGSAVEMTQQIYSTTVAAPATSGSILNIPPRNVGLIKGFLVEVTGTATNTGSTTAATLTELNLANVLSQIVFTDLNNNVRINTTGWHIDIVNTAKQRGVWGAAYTTDSPIKYGSNWNVIAATNSIPATSDNVLPFYMMYWIPLAYSDDDLRGSVYANVVNATMNLQLTINTSPFAASGDSTLAVYKSNTGTFTNVTVTVYQVYLDQLPVGNQGVILPLQDLSTIYELKNTTLQGIVTAQDFPVPYANFRTFLSTVAIYDNGGTLGTGSDVNYWALQSANFTNIWKIDPFLAALKSRLIFGDDPPKGVYYFDHRRQPINTIQYGNMELILNAAGTVNAGAVLLMGFEDFAIINAVSQAGSLPAS